MSSLRNHFGWRGKTETINGFKAHVCAEVGHYPGFAVVETKEGLVCCRMRQEEDGWLYMEPEGVAPRRACANTYLERRSEGEPLKSCFVASLCTPVSETLGAAFPATFKMEQRKNEGRATRVQVVTYSADPEIGVFCELLLPDEERISISVAREGVTVSLLAAAGATPGTVLWESGDLVALSARLGCPEPSPGALLSALQSSVMQCGSSEEVERKLAPPAPPPGGAGS